MGDGDGGAAGHQAVQGVLHDAFGFGVQRGGGLVQDQDRRVLEDGAGDGQALALSAGELGPAVADVRVVALGLLHDEVMGVGDLRGGDDLLPGGSFHAEGDVVENGVVEQDRILVHIAHQGAEVLDPQVLDILSVDGDAAAVGVVEAGDEVHERGLAGAGLAHDGDHLAARSPGPRPSESAGRSHRRR